MKRFDLFENPDGAGLLLVIQADLLESLNTRVVVPLLPRAQAPTPATRLNPVFEIDGESYVMVTQFIATLPSGLLKRHVGSIEAEFAAITTALDTLLTGV